MAKKRAVRKTPGRDVPDSGSTGEDQLKAAADAVQRARAALDQAVEAYDCAREKATEQVTKARRVTIGDIIDGTLDFARRHPAAGLFSAGFIGFLLGRIRGR